MEIEQIIWVCQNKNSSVEYDRWYVIFCICQRPVAILSFATEWAMFRVLVESGERIEWTLGSFCSLSLLCKKDCKDANKRKELLFLQMGKLFTEYSNFILYISPIVKSQRMIIIKLFLFSHQCNIRSDVYLSQLTYNDTKIGRKVWYGVS